MNYYNTHFITLLEFVVIILVCLQAIFVAITKKIIQKINDIVNI